MKKSQVNSSVLANPRIYELFKIILLRSKKTRSFYVQEYIRAKKGDRILDMGCGTADVLAYLPDVEYIGFDMSQEYIDHAIKKYGNRERFFCQKMDKNLMNKYLDFDIVMANGILHHLSDEEALVLFGIAKASLKQGGRLITLDGCYIDGQSRLIRYFLSKDRGRYVRTKDEYLELASKVFSNVQVHIHHNLLRIPYTHIVMECKNENSF